MRRSLVPLILLLALPAGIAAAQADTASTPSTIASTPSTTATTPTFHAGQWAARFAMANSVFGIGALHFSTPDKAWTLFGSVSGSYSRQNGTSNAANNESISLAVGRRWYRPATARVRPFGGLGASGGFGRGHQVSGANSQTSRGFSGSLYGELGATIFFAPELSLGASWTAGIGANYYANYLNGTKMGSNTAVSASGGDMLIEGAFYF